MQHTLDEHNSHILPVFTQLSNLYSVIYIHSIIDISRAPLYIWQHRDLGNYGKLLNLQLLQHPQYTHLTVSRVNR